MVVPAVAQESGHTTDVKHERQGSYHQVQIGIGHTHIIAVNEDLRDRRWVALASWNLNYNYHIDQRWLIGLHTDLILDKFEIEHGEGDMIERSNPFAIAGMVGYHFWGPFTGLVGGGVELESNRNIGFIRLGLEPGWHFGGGKWEVSLISTYEIKIDAYNSWLFAIGISRFFGFD